MLKIAMFRERIPLSPLVLALTAMLCLESRAAAPMDLVDAKRVKELTAWLPAQPRGAGQPITNRVFWDALAQSEDGRILLNRAAGEAKQPLTSYTDEHFLDFSKTGNRTRGQRAMAPRAERLELFTLAECLENRGTYLPLVIQVLEALSTEKTWVMPAHDRSLGNFNGKLREIDLRSSALAWETATADWLLGDKLPKQTRDLVRTECERRVLQPFRDMLAGKEKEIYWLRATHNWNAVCLAGVTGAALTLEPDPAARALHLAAAERFVQFFLEGFTADGYCSEGVGYWNYGFGNFLVLNEMARQQTANRLEFLASPKAYAAAMFSRNAEIIDGFYPSIADCSPGSQPDAWLKSYIGMRFGAEPPRPAPFPAGTLSATALYAAMEAAPPRLTVPLNAPVQSPLRTWFKQGGVLICRPETNTHRFAAVLKGGHNAEHHNHNDVGTFIVVSDGAVVLCDPGAEVYTARTFSSQRYDSKVLNSYGHPVPVVAGQLQSPGSQARGLVVRENFSPARDELTLDLRSAYKVPGLRRLERSFTYQRHEPGLQVVDQVKFEKPETFETALITWGSVKQTAPNELTIADGTGSVRVQVDSGGLPWRMKTEIITEDVRRKPTRVGLKLDQPVKEARFQVTITPVKVAPAASASKKK
jgi:hypothetical protein